MIHAPTKTSAITPSMLYHDAPAAIDWLCRAFGFERHLVVQDGDTVRHAQLSFDGGMIMLGSAEWTGGPELMVSPRELGGVGTQAVCVRIDDADLHHARAVAEGAEVVLPLYDADYGGRGYSCRDPEGHVWHFGTYDPWA